MPCPLSTHLSNFRALEGYLLPVSMRLFNHASETTITYCRQRAAAGRRSSRNCLIVLSALRQRTATVSTLSCKQPPTELSVTKRFDTDSGRAIFDHYSPCPAHLAWARRHLAWTRQQRAAALFTDESHVSRSFHDGRIRVLRRQGEHYHDPTAVEPSWCGVGCGRLTPL